MRLRAPILVKLLVALVLPTVALFTLFAVIAYELSKDDLDAELGRRLEAIAASASTQIRGSYIAELGAGNVDDRAYQNTLAKLEQFARVTGAQLFVFDPGFTTSADTTGDAAIGSPNYRVKLDREELRWVFLFGFTASSTTYEGKDGKIYKTGYAPIRASESDPRIVLAIGAQAPASYFARLADLRDRLLVWGAGLVLVSILAAVISTLLITRNVRRLAVAADRIGAGDLRQRVQISSHDELGLLGQTMDRMRAQLAERDARMQQMLAGIAHEVRNPLAGMTLFAGLLRDELPDGDDRRSHVDRIQRELGYLERVVNEFLEFARRPRPTLTEVAVGELLAEVAQLVTSDDIEVGVEPGEPAAVRADRGQLRRALINLGRNAVQAAAAAGQRGPGAVRIAARRRGAELWFAVWNRGADIAPETSGKLFEPFYTTREKGTGLGLAFVREIAADHGGRIEVASGGGETTFTLVIPA